LNKDEILLTLDDFILELKYQEKADRTLTKYRADIKRFLESVKHNNDITKNDVMAYKSLVGKLYAPRSINSYIVAINKFLIWSGCEDMKVKKLKMQEKYSINNVPSDADYHRMLRFAKRMGYPEIYMIMKVIKRTGIRISELAFFTVEAVKDSFYIHIRNKGKDRDAVMTQDLARELRKYARDHNITKGPIFTIANATVWRRLHKIAGAAKVSLDKAHAHGFRHLFGKDYIEQCNDVVGLADMLGHSSLETTRIYTRNTNEEKRHKLESMRQ